ncbi:MAG: hypothetical protein ABR505_01270 [Actinomycetota bacterium]
MDESSRRFDRLIKEVRDGLPVLGERFLFLGSGPLPIADAVGAALAVDERGATVLIAALHTMTPETADQLKGQLDEISTLSEQDLDELQQGPFLGRPLKERVGLVFGGPERAPASINQRQRLFLIVDEPPPEEARRRLVVILPDELRGVFTSNETGFNRILLPTPPRPKASAARPLPRPITPERPASYWLSLGIVLVGVALIVTAIVRAGDRGDPLAEGVVESPLRTIATGVPSNVTQTFLVGQKRVVRLSDGRLVVVLPTRSGVQLIVDDNNQGRTWQSPIALDGSPATSLSVAPDASDRLHVVTGDEAQISYMTVTEGGAGWAAGPALVLDASATSPVLDVAWDEATQLAHAVWIHQDGETSQPIWGSIRAGRPPQLIQTQVLADSGDVLQPLVNVAVDSRSNLLVTYNHPDESGGWYSQTASAETDEAEVPVFVWSDEEKIPVAARYGGAALVIDQRRTAHLVLRDDGAARLMYFEKDPGEDWSRGEPAVRAASAVEVDHPGIAVDAASRLIYLFFQRAGDRPEIQVVIRDPATGWEGPYQIVTEQDLPEGAVFPAVLPALSGPAIVLWTTAGPNPVLQAVRVTAP